MGISDKIRAYETHLENEYQRQLCRQEAEAERFEQVVENIGKELEEAEFLLEKADDGEGLRVFAHRLEEIAEMAEELSHEF